MVDQGNPRPGTIAWRDLTVPDADSVSKFYSAVVGWKREVFDGDYNMILPGGGAPAAGICFARGVNANLPPQWLIYIVVRDLEESLRNCLRLRGELLDGPRAVGSGRFCVIRDPAGAVAALLEETR
jgi:predicted enzyme related to lactoylglutathione lyase